MITVNRGTEETEIRAELDLYGTGEYNIGTGIGFLNHMLELWCKHGFIDLKLKVEGDLEVDKHHTVEDTGIVLGTAIRRQLGKKAGIRRYASLALPMDESLVLVALDMGGRAHYFSDLEFTREMVGEFPVELLREFFISLTTHGRFTLHYKMLRGGNNHHLLEACFKGFGRALDRAVKPDSRLGAAPLSTKGTLGEEGDE